ncbi:MAG: IS4 family transposase, partial [Deltaproteobacteria bacterium]|nr:IS4 family transposase [Deltaproteobacteria bacterium]
MSRNKKTLPIKTNLTHLLSIGLFARVVPKTLIDESLAMTNRGSQRIRLFPASAVVYFVMAMSMFREPPLEEIVRIFSESTQHLARQTSNLQLPGKAAISQARIKMGSEPMRLIADKVLKPIATANFQGAWYKGMRLMSVDVTCFDMPDEAENASYFGCPSCSRGQKAFPQARVLALVETGTHVITAAEIAPYGISEQAMTKKLIERGKLTQDMLLLADRNFVGYRLWSAADDTGAKLVWRAEISDNLPMIDVLPDGSFT